MKIQYTSDIHLDIRKDFQLKRAEGCKVLLLAGDIGQPFKGNYASFLKTLGDYDHVFLVAGNHEFYSSSHDHATIERRLWDLSQEIPNLHWLHRSMYDLGDVVILGVTLWSQIQNKTLIEQSMSDYARIRIKRQGRKHKIDADVTNSWHKQDLEWLLRRLDQLRDRQVIVMSHHAPSKTSCAAYHERNPGATPPELDQAYCMDLEWVCERYPNIKAWIHGHVHAPVQHRVGECDILCSPVGYPSEAGLPANGGVVTIS